jgi:AraC-like DNA-binding protein
MPTIEPILHPIVISQVMINFAASFGIDKETCLLGTDIPEELLQDSEALIPRSQEMRLVENLILAIPNEPALGFKLGLQYSVSTFGVWGFALRTSRTLREAAVIALRYLPLSTAYCRMQQVDDSGYFSIVFDSDSIPGPIRQFLLERDIATGVNIINELSLAGLKLSSVEFQGPPPEYAAEIETLIDLKPLYHCARNALSVTVEEADRLLPTYDSQLVLLMDKQCRYQLDRRKKTGIIGLVQQQILGPLGLVASVEEVAKALAMSPRSLRRKLESENTTYKNILDQERQQIAQQLLHGSKMKLDELAFHLGYADTASFSRAFRRWKGCSPGEYRNSPKL